MQKIVPIAVPIGTGTGTAIAIPFVVCIAVGFALCGVKVKICGEWAGRGRYLQCCSTK